MIALSNFIDVDDVHASLIVVYKDTVEEYPIRGAWSIKNHLLDVKSGDIFNIQGLGRLKVLQVRTMPKENQFVSIVEVIISTRWISDEWDSGKSAMVASLITSMLSD